jgi:hypothetical protein
MDLMVQRRQNLNEGLLTECGEPTTAVLDRSKAR